MPEATDKNFTKWLLRVIMKIRGVSEGWEPTTSDEICLKPEAEELLLASDEVLHETRISSKRQ